MKTIPPSATGRAGGDPVAPAHDERRILTESASHDDVLAAGAGQHRAGFRQRDGAKQGVQTADDPDADEERRIGQLRRHIARCPEDADKDGIADEHRDPERDTEDLAQPASAGRRDQRGCADDVIGAIGGVGQLDGR